MNTMLLLVILVVVFFNVIFYIIMFRRTFGSGRREELPEEGHFVFKVPDKNFTYSIPVDKYEKSRTEPVEVPGTKGIYLFRGQVYESLDSAIEEMVSRLGSGAAAEFRARIGKGKDKEK